MARKKYAVEITATAETDVWEIHDYIARDKPAAAHKWVESLTRRIDSLASSPQRHEVIPEAKELGIEYRHMLLGNYRIIYRTDGRRVIILRVIHGARLLDTSMLTLRDKE